MAGPESSKGGTDANGIQLSRDGVATGPVGIPNRYMHTPVEVYRTQLVLDAILESAGRGAWVQVKE